MTAPMHVRILPMGEAALLVETDGIDAVLALEAVFSRLAKVGAWAEVDDLVPAARTLLVVARPDTDLRALEEAVRVAAVGAGSIAASGDHRVVEILVRYDGPDLDDVATLTGLTRDAVIEAHTGTPWDVGFGGFAPGFAYLVGGDPRLEVPRRAVPRTRVPAGSVGLAGEFSGIYPRESPGGWQLLGTTDTVLWDVERDPPALLTPGTTVRFIAQTTHPHRAHAAVHPSVAVAPPAPPAARAARAARAVEVLEPGLLTIVQDRGRFGLLAVGVGRSGAADRASYELGSRLLGNEPSAAALEVTFGGVHIRAHGELLACLTGAPAPGTVAGRPVPCNAPFALSDGDELQLRMPPSGLRTYLSVRGGLAVDPVLGSRATDTMSGLGPAPAAAGDVLPVGDQKRSLPCVDVAAVAGPAAGPLTLGVLPGPRHEWFARPEAFAETEWAVSERSDRKGIRFDGSPVERHADWADAELPSEGMVRGAIQVPPNGLPVLFLNDHPVTGGYPVIGVVRSADVDRAAQLRPGQRVHFRWDKP